MVLLRQPLAFIGWLILSVFLRFYPPQIRPSNLGNSLGAKPSLNSGITSSNMKILITGAAGFIGQHLARELLKNPENKLILTDISYFSTPPSSIHPENAICIQADLVKEPQAVLIEKVDAVYILHGIMSSGAEANLDLGLKVNVDATRNLLDCIRKKGPHTRVIYGSSIAVYGRPFPEIITENVYPTPEGSYGCEKVICETLINDYTRRGYIDGVSIRLPGVIIRPGPPAQAASGFLSGIIREPLAGKKCIVPTKDRSKAFWVCSINDIVSNLAYILGFPVDILPLHRRVLNAPGILVTIQEMRDTLAKAAGQEMLDFIEEVEDTTFADLVQSWPCNFDVSLAVGIGLSTTGSFEDAVEQYMRAH
jgi:nucleoside-diphosphate-sugar epimerase